MLVAPRPGRRFLGVVLSSQLLIILRRLPPIPTTDPGISDKQSRRDELEGTVEREQLAIVYAERRGRSPTQGLPRAERS